METKQKVITLGELRSQMAWTEALPDETPVIFGDSDLSLSGVKNRGGSGDMVQFEFAETYLVTLDPGASQ